MKLGAQDQTLRGHPSLSLAPSLMPLSGQQRFLREHCIVKHGRAPVDYVGHCTDEESETQRGKQTYPGHRANGRVGS